MDDRYERIEAITGYSIEELNSMRVDDLNAVPPSLIEACRKLEGTPLRITFLKAITTETMSGLFYFQEDVVRDGAPVESWGKGSFYKRDASLKEQLVEPRAVLLAEVGDPFSWVGRVSVRSWMQGNSEGGPARLDLSTTYRTPWIPKVMRYSLQFEKFLAVEPKDVGVLFVRWIAQRIALCSYRRETGKVELSYAYLAEQAPFREWTPEARLALQGLEKELELAIPLDQTVPGYGGPDEWYRPD